MILGSTAGDVEMNVKKLFFVSVMLFDRIIWSSYCDTLCQIKVITHDHKPWLMYFFNSITHVKQYLNIYHIKIIGLKAPKSFKLDEINTILFHRNFLLTIFYLSPEELFCFIVCCKSYHHTQSAQATIYKTINCDVSTFT